MTTGPIILFTAKLGFSNATVNIKLWRTGKVLRMMNGNLHFSNPVPSLASVGLIYQDLTKAQARVNGTKLNYEIRDNLEKKLDKAMSQLQAYVDNVSGGNTEIILSSGFEIRNSRTVVGLLDAPADFKFIPTNAEGQIKLKWKKVKNSKSYLVEMTTDPESGEWKTAGAVTKTKLVLDTLVPGKIYYFRISAISSAGQGGASKVIRCMAGFN